MTQPSALVCSRCGAPLGAVGPDGLAHCPYCEAETRVAGSPRPPPTPYYDPQLAARQAQQFQYQANAAKQARRFSLLFMIIPFAVAMIGVVTSLVMTSNTGHPTTATPVAAETHGTTGASHSHSGPNFWSLSPPGCLVDGNGDGVLDVFGMAGESSDALEPTLVNGSNGHILWKAKVHPKETESFCLSKDWVGVAEPNFSIELFSARHPAHPIAVKGRDKLEAFALGHGCAELKTADGSRFGVKLPGGGFTHCRTGKLTRMLNDKLGLIGLTGEHTAIESAGTIYSLEKRANGTPMLTVTATRGRHRLFSKELPYAATTFASAIAEGDFHILVWGAKPGARDKPFLIGLNANDGHQLYALPQSNDPPGSVSFFEFNGRYVVAAYWGALHAYDPSTGHEKWQVGR